MCFSSTVRGALRAIRQTHRNKRGETKTESEGEDERVLNYLDYGDREG